MLSGSLVPGRFLLIISHISVVATLLWQSQETTRSCLRTLHPQVQDQIEYYQQIYHNRLVVGFVLSLTFSLAELIVFMSGLTMFHPSLSLWSVGCHGAATIALTNFSLEGWFCDWYWGIFAIGDVVPFVSNLFVTTVALTCRYM